MIASPRSRAPLAALLALACATPSGESPPAPDTGAGADTAAVSPPAPDRSEPPRRPGTLSWEDLTVRMVGESGPNAGLRIDVTTLHPEALRLAGDDVRAYFEDLEKRTAEAIAGEERRATPFLVGFTGFEKEVSFDPTRLRLRSEGSTHYPRTIVPASPAFDRRLVGLYETVYAVYLFEPDIDLLATLEFRYDDLSTGSRWRRVVEEIERAKTRDLGERRRKEEP